MNTKPMSHQYSCEYELNSQESKEPLTNIGRAESKKGDLSHEVSVPARADVRAAIPFVTAPIAYSIYAIILNFRCFSPSITNPKGINTNGIAGMINLGP